MTVASGSSWWLRRGDSLLALRALPSSSADGILTDPPYSSGGFFRGDRMSSSSEKYRKAGSSAIPEVQGDNRDQRGFLAWSSMWLAECLRIARDGAVLAVFSDWRQLPTTTDAIQAGGWVWRGIAPWCKPWSRPQKGRLRQDAEFVVWGSKGKLPVDRGVPIITGHWLEEAPPHWIQFAPHSSRREHMTEKPLGLMRDLARLTVPGGTVLDPFAGAATTGVAALLEGRRFVGLEVSAEYFEIAARRLRDVDAGNGRDVAAVG